MASPPQDPGSGPRIRARARGGSSSIRPEVADALGGVERSLSEVAKWEQMLAGRPEGGPVVPVLPEGYVGIAMDELPPAEEAEADAPDDEAGAEVEEVPIVREVGLLDAVREAEEGADPDDDAPEDAAAAADALVASLAASADDTAAHETQGSVLWAARTVEGGTAEPTEETIARRRRNARVLSWAGALILVAGAALWLVPDRSDDDKQQGELPAVEATSTTLSRSRILGDTGTTATTATTEPPTTTEPETTDTTTRRTTATTAPRSATTQPTPTTVSPTSTLGLPGSPGTVNPVRTVPTAPPTTQPPPATTVPSGGSTDGGSTGGPTTGG